MKPKHLFFLFAAIFVGFYSCSNDDNNPGNTNQTAILGTWDAQVGYYGGTFSTPYRDTSYIDTIDFDEGDYAKVTFKGDGTFTSESSDDGEIEHGNGSYVFNGSTLTINSNSEMDDSLFVPTMNCTIHNNKMALSYDSTYTFSYDSSGVEIQMSAKISSEIHFIKE